MTRPSWVMTRTCSEECEKGGEGRQVSSGWSQRCRSRVQLMRRGGAPETEEEGCKLRFEVSCEQRKESSSLST
jgi:hypothetical protein